MTLHDVEDAYTLTPLQQGMLYHILAEPDNDIYIAYITMQMKGAINVDQLQRAWHSVFQKHTALRASFLWKGLDEPLQVVHKQITIPWTTHTPQPHEVSTDDGRKQFIEKLIETERCQPLELSQAPLSRLHFIRWSQTDSSLLWVVNHLLADDWSTPIVLHDVADAYQHSDNNALIEHSSHFQFGDHVAWLAKQSREIGRAHWQSYLAGRQPTPLCLPPIRNKTQHEEDNSLGKTIKHEGDVASRQPPPSIEQLTTTLSDADNQRLTQFCRSTSLTLSTVIHGLWALTISRYTQCSSPLFGSSVSGRQSGQAGIENAVGLFLNTLPVVVDITTEPLVDWLQKLQQALLHNLAHEQSALSMIQSLVERDANMALFDSVVVVESHAKELQIASPDKALLITDIDYLTISNFPLTLLVFGGSTLTTRLVYKGDSIPQCMIQAINADFTHLIKQLPLLSSTPGCSPTFLRDCLTARHTSQALKIGKSQIPTTHNIVDSFENACDLSPEVIALCSDGQQIQYRTLDERANQFAQAIAGMALPTGQLIGISIPRSTDMVAAILGVLKSGHPYVPIDPDYPDERIRTLLSHSAAGVLITAERDSAKFKNTSIRKLTAEHTLGHAKDRLNLSISQDSVAYLLFTSGSTGTPKGVLVTHKNLSYSTDARIAYYAGIDSSLKTPNFLLLSSVSFDSSVAGIYWSLCAGGTLTLPRPGEEKDMNALARLIHQYKVSVTLCLPSLYRLLITLTPRDMRMSLSHVIVAGETCTNAIVDAHHFHQAHAHLYNEYGPTEATVWSSVFHIPPESANSTDSTLHDHSTDKQTHHRVPASLPIGEPIGDTSIALLGLDNLPSPSGTEGEIVIGGNGVAAGYNSSAIDGRPAFASFSLPGLGLNRWYKTGDTGYWDENGQLNITGRIDRQLKIRGHRIEPAEVESVLETHPDISEAAVTVHRPDRSTAPQPRASSALDHTLSAEELYTILCTLDSVEAHALIDNIDTGKAS